MPTMIITNAGEQAFAAATNTAQINLAEVRLGSGHNATPKTATALTAPLSGLVYPITPVTDTIERYAVVERLDANAISLQCVDRSDDAVAPTEIGLFTTGGALIAYYSVGSGNIFNKAASSRWQFAVRLAFSNLDTATIAFTQNAILPATEARAGIAQIATQAEARAGVDDTKFVTPSKMLDTIGQNAFQVQAQTEQRRVNVNDGIVFSDISETGNPNRRTSIGNLFNRIVNSLASLSTLHMGDKMPLIDTSSGVLRHITLAQVARLFRIGAATAGTPTLSDEIALMDASASADVATGYKPNLRASLSDVQEVLVKDFAREGSNIPIDAVNLRAYRQVYDTAGTFTFTKPSGVNFFHIQMWGGGGGGVKAQGRSTHGLGGGGAYLAITFPTEHLEATEQVIVGAAAAPIERALNQAQEAAGNDGGDTQFKGLTANGGHRAAIRAGSGGVSPGYGRGGTIQTGNLPPEIYQEPGRGGTGASDFNTNYTLARPYYAGGFGTGSSVADSDESEYGYSYGNGSGYATGSPPSPTPPPFNGTDGAVIITGY